jgi:hypothetical protein
LLAGKGWLFISFHKEQKMGKERKIISLDKDLGLLAFAALKDLNNSLVSGEGYLDWTEVRIAPPGQLTTLLAGLNIIEHADIINIDTVPSSLYLSVLAALRVQKGESLQQRVPPAEKLRGIPANPPWTPDGEGEDPDITTPRKMHSTQDEAELVLQHNAVPQLVEKPHGPMLWTPDGKGVDPDTTAIKKMHARQDEKELVSYSDASVPPRLYDFPAIPILPDLQGSPIDGQMEGHSRVQDRHLISLLASRSVRTIPALSDLDLDMQGLAVSDLAALPNKLQSLVDMYHSWINAYEVDLSNAPVNLHEARLSEAFSVLQQCRRTLACVRIGIDLLARSREAAQAFSFMNRVMWLQHIRTLYTQKKQSDKTIERPVDLSENPRWRPLQLAFILLNLPLLTDVPLQQSSYNGRHTGANLPWFRVGEGKIEAYLGLSAYTLALRRLQSISVKSVEDSAVMMCYSPHHFLVEQFQHISALIAACETIRSTAREWGKPPFQLGVWESSLTTSKTIDDTTRIFRAGAGMGVGKRFARGDGFAQLTWCPWCGGSIENEKNRTLISCCDPEHKCPFSKSLRWGEGLVFLIDEAHRMPLPPLLIAIDDEIAEVPWPVGTQIHFV